MKAKLFDAKGHEKGTIDLPKCFAKKVRADILAKVFYSQTMSYMQPYGAKLGAGAQYSASGLSKKRRHVWKGTYGKSIARIPRKIMSRHGASFNWVGATVSSTRGGRAPNAPRVAKNLFKKVNKKELLLAFNSALAGSIGAKYLEMKYGKKAESGYVFTSDVLKLKTKVFLEVMKNLFGESYANILKTKTVRAGVGKLRGRKYKSNAGLLFVVGNDEEMKRKGIEVVKANELTIADLAPNGEAGRFTCYTEKAIKDLGERFN